MRGRGADHSKFPKGRTSVRPYSCAGDVGSYDNLVTSGSSTGTPDGAVDINDLLFFLAHFEAGC